MASISFEAGLRKIGVMGEKTGWTCIAIPADIAEQIKPATRKGFRVKGKIDSYKFEAVFLAPRGDGSFILPVNAEMRKGIRKAVGAMVKVQLQEDKQPFVFNEDLINCLKDEPSAYKFFEKLAGSHQRYFSKWVDSAKTEATKTKRIVQCVSALAKSNSYGEMIRNLKAEKDARL